MKKLTIDVGIEEFEVNGTSILRFNPSDPNVYARFVAAVDKVTQIEEDLVKKAKQITNDGTEDIGFQSLQLLEVADRKVKEILTEVFGNQNDFDKIFSGVNLMAVAANGERVLTNFFAAVAPIVTEGAQKCAREQAASMVAEVRPNRQQRRASGRGK